MRGSRHSILQSSISYRCPTPGTRALGLCYASQQKRRTRPRRAEAGARMVSARAWLPASGSGSSWNGSGRVRPRPCSGVPARHSRVSTCHREDPNCNSRPSLRSVGSGLRILGDRAGSTGNARLSSPPSWRPGRKWVISIQAMGRKDRTVRDVYLEYKETHAPAGRRP